MGLIGWVNVVVEGELNQRCGDTGYLTLLSVERMFRDGGTEGTKGDNSEAGAMPTRPDHIIQN